MKMNNKFIPLTFIIVMLPDENDLQIQKYLLIMCYDSNLDEIVFFKTTNLQDFSNGETTESLMNGGLSNFFLNYVM